MISQQPDIGRIYLYANDPYEAKYKFSINKRESTGLRNFNDAKVFITYSNDMDDFLKTLKNTTKMKNVKH